MQNGSNRRRVWVAGILLGIGLGGFFDGIVFHQILQWHHMLTSAGYPPTTVENLHVNMLWDGVFHAFTYVVTVMGIFLLWRSLRMGRAEVSSRVLVGSMLVGWGVFNLVEGAINHHVLGLHHVRDDLPAGTEQLVWDLAFLVWGAAMLAFGAWLARYERAAAMASRA